MADKNPRKALYYVLWAIIGVLLSVIGAQHRNIASIEEDCQSREDTIRAESKRESKVYHEQIISLLQSQLEQEKNGRKQDKEANREQILELNSKVEALLTKSIKNDNKYEKVENRIERFSTETKKIEAVIQK